ncbi:MAG TPA: MFS transporter [Verrucomicrobiae bacterium]|jgi:MFS family permease|nr:MFS transporter [Verrucomicrobiae bacterium]
MSELPANHKGRTLWLTGMLHCFTHLYGVALLPLYLLMQRDLKLDSVSKATSLVTIMMVAYFLPSYPLGVLADRTSRKKLLAYGLLINAFAFIGLAFARNYSWAVTFVILAGIGGSAYHPAATAMIARLFPKNTGRALGLAGIGSGTGFFVGPLYTGWRAATLEPVLGAAAWRRPILEIGILGILAAGVFAWMASEEAVVITDRKETLPTGKLFPTPALWFFFLLASFLFSLRDFAGLGMASLSSLFLQNAEGYDTRRAGIAVSALFIGSIVSNPLLGSLSDGRRKRWIAIVIGTGSSLIIIFPHLPGPWTIPCLLAFGFFFLASFPIVEAALMQSVPDAVRGRVFGIYVTITGFVGGLAAWVIGLLVKHMGDAAGEGHNYFELYAAVGSLGLLALIGLPCLHAIRKRELLDETPSGLPPAVAAGKGSSK